MENVFKYFEFSDFIKDTSGAFSGSEICFTVLNETHFLIFEKNNSIYNLFDDIISNLYFCVFGSKLSFN